MYEAASKFSDEQFLMKLAYLSDVFGKLNELNLQPNGLNVYIGVNVITISGINMGGSGGVV